jgi:hypothetical protein
MRNKTGGNKHLIYLFGVLLAVALASGLVLYATGSDSSEATVENAAGTAKAFAGGTFEASGATRVPGTNSIFFVDDGKPGAVLWMQLDNEGNQSGPIKVIDLGVNIDDLEGITTDGSYFYVVNSQAKAKSSGQAGIVRFKFNPASQSAEEAQATGSLKQFLVENVAELREMGTVKAKDDGINIEGLAWDPAEGRLLLGMRSPVAGDDALLIPLKLRDPRGQFSLENLEAKETRAIRLPLGGQGVRGIEYDERSKLFHIIAGATESQDKTNFKLWEWGGQADQPVLREVATFDKKLKPEGVTRASGGSNEFKIIVFDTSRYLKMP